jgi:putative colanic acid biosynthesis acetyltransferase WcaF
MYAWRRFLLKLFGAKVGKDVRIRQSVRVTYPWKVSIGERSWIGDNVELYSLGDIKVGSDVVISQRSYLCAATHDYQRTSFDMVEGPIVVEDQAWVAADVFVGPGVNIARGALIGARSSVFDDMPEGMVCVGSPAKPVRPRRE